jgi:phospholipase/lecithinase/hemolysin
MKTHVSIAELSFRRFRARLVSAIAIVLVLLAARWLLAAEPDSNSSAAPRVDSAHFSRLIVFGDSLSDTGNFYSLTGGYPPPPYANGRFSNGSLWVEYLADDLGTPLVPGDNYAVAGAMTGHGNSNDGFLGMIYPGLQDELAAFLATEPPGDADPQALYIIWTGANDIFVALASQGDPETLIRDGVANTVHAVQLLRADGARHIMVPNIPDLGLTPYGLASGQSDAITRLCAAYNRALKSALLALSDAGIATIRPDAFATLRTMVRHQAQFDFTDVTQPFLAVGGDPVGFLFWDAVHPTTRAHEVLADEALTRVIHCVTSSRQEGTTEGPANVVRELAGVGQTGPGPFYYRVGVKNP